MERKLTEFASLLRNQGLAISQAEVTDAARVMQNLGFADRERLRLGLGLALAKSEFDKPLFYHCFDQFFTITDFSSDPNVASMDSPHSPTLPQEASGEGAMSGGGSGGSGSGEASQSELAELLGNDDREKLQLKLAEAVDKSGLSKITVLTQKGIFTRRILIGMGLLELEADIQGLEGDGSVSSLARAELLKQGKKRLQLEAKETVERYFQLAKVNRREEVISGTDIKTLNEFHDVKAVVRRMAKRLITTHSRRKKRENRGQLDIRHTLRANVAYDGLIVEPAWRRKKIDRPKVIAVCDVSRSVSAYARFLLMFLYSLQEIIPRVRAFAFSSSLGEVTELFERMPMDSALDEVMANWGFGSTDYGRAFLDLHHLALNDLDRNTTVIILGDARNNNGDAEADTLKLIQSRVKQVLWINPESINRWGSGDSEMLRYKSFCSKVVSCQSLSQLEHAIDWMLKRS